MGEFRDVMAKMFYMVMILAVLNVFTVGVLIVR